MAHAKRAKKGHKKAAHTHHHKPGLFGFLKKKKSHEKHPDPKHTAKKPAKKEQKAPKKQFKDLKKKKKKAKPQFLALERRKRLKAHLEKAGIPFSSETVMWILVVVSGIINIGLTSYVLYRLISSYGFVWQTLLIYLAIMWFLVFFVLLFITWIILYGIMDLLMYKRKVEIENVLPDYLQLTASNIKAGMTVDKALWFAVRPRFGVLAREIEIAAKETMSGDDLKVSLRRFADKYDSVTLHRSMNLLIEGLEAGGEIGNLLNKIAVNIQENRIMKEEMAASVTSYLIFIGFATAVAAPGLFALSGVLIRTISSIGQTLAQSGGTASGFAISFSGDAILYSDFRIFAFTMLIITSFFSSVIMSTIKKGNAVGAAKYFPFFVIISILIFIFADILLSGVVSAFF